jgi:hypothetical protein
MSACCGQQPPPVGCGSIEAYGAVISVLPTEISAPSLDGHDATANTCVSDPPQSMGSPL